MQEQRLLKSLIKKFQLQVLINIGIKNIIHDSSKKMNKRNHRDFYEYYNQEILDILENLVQLVTISLNQFTNSPGPPFRGTLSPSAVSITYTV